MRSDTRAGANALRAIAGRLGGEVHGGGKYALVPGPGHGPSDRSLKVWAHNGALRVHSFAGDDWRECRRYLGIEVEGRGAPPPRHDSPPATGGSVAAPARPTRRVKDLMRTSAAPADVADVVAYLSGRNLWPLTAGGGLRAHVRAPYWEDGPRLVGFFSAMLAPVVDVKGELVTAHITFLRDGRKAEVASPRKLLGATTGRRGVCVRLMPAAEVVLVAEGIETALAAGRIFGVPAWSALDAGHLAKWSPPPAVERVLIAADADTAGVAAAGKLHEALRDRVKSEIVMPVRADFADDWLAAATAA